MSSGFFFPWVHLDACLWDAAEPKELHVTILVAIIRRYKCVTCADTVLIRGQVTFDMHLSRYV